MTRPLVVRGTTLKSEVPLLRPFGLDSVNTPISGLIIEAAEFRPRKVADFLGLEGPQVFEEEPLDPSIRVKIPSGFIRQRALKWLATPSPVAVKVFSVKNPLWLNSSESLPRQATWEECARVFLRRRRG